MSTPNDASLLDFRRFYEADLFVPDVQSECQEEILMDDLGNLSSQPKTALVILAFLQADCTIRNGEYCKELFSLSKDLTLAQDTNWNVSRINSPVDEDIETDGHLPSSLTISLDGIQPSVEFHRNHEEAVALQRVAEELREIAAQLEHNVVAQATQNLRRNISTTPFYKWSYLLNWEVDKVMSGFVGLEHLPQERIVLALTLTLVKGVCQQAPQLLRNLFYAALQYISSSSRAK